MCEAIRRNEEAAVDAAAAFALARTNYCAYTVLSHHGRWIAGRLHRYLCDRVQEFIQKPTDAPYEILILSVPPQHGKSQSVTETLPSWYLGNYPEKRVIEASYNDDFAGRFGRRNKAKIEEFGEAVFGIRIGAKSSDRDFEIAGHSGSMISRGIMAGITGNPGDLIIIDDPVKNREEADSPTRREKVWGEWENSIRTRTQAGSKVIVIQTRWHEDDLAGRMIQREPNVSVVNLPCEAEAGDLLGRKPGEALCPELGKGDDWLLQFKRAYQTKSGARAWNSLYQGRPSAQEGNLLRRQWWRFYRTLPELEKIILSVDAAFKGGEGNDFVAIQAWGKRGADCYLLDAVRKHLDFPQTLQEIRRMKEKYPKACAIYIEDKANGSAAISMLRREIPGVAAVNPAGGKVSRVHAVSPAIEAGNVYLPEFADWLGAFIEECSAFPNGAHDDQVDAMSQALNRLLYYYSGPASEEAAKPEFPFRVPAYREESPVKGGKIRVI